MEGLLRNLKPSPPDMTRSPPEDDGSRRDSCPPCCTGGVMFTADAVPGLADGSITVTFRRWKRPQAKVGWPVPQGRSLVRGRRGADRARGPHQQGRRPSLLGRPTPTWCAADSEIRLPTPRCTGWRSTASIPPGRPRTRPTSVSTRSPRSPAAWTASTGPPSGPWTRATLALIATQPGVVSTALAETWPRALRPEDRHPQAEAPRPHPEPGGGLPSCPPGARPTSTSPRRCRGSTTRHDDSRGRDLRPCREAPPQAEDRGMRTTRLDITLGVV